MLQLRLHTSQTDDEVKTWCDSSTMDNANCSPFRCSHHQRDHVNTCCESSIMDIADCFTFVCTPSLTDDDVSSRSQ